MARAPTRPGLGRLCKADEKRLIEVMMHKTITSFSNIEFSTIHNMEANKISENNIQLIDAVLEGEHFVESTLQLSQGYHYFIFETIPTHTELSIYFLGETASVLLRWGNSLPSLQKWEKINNGDGLEFVFSQEKMVSKLEQFKVLIYSVWDQEIQVRWQHMSGGLTIYKGEKKNVSHICKAQFEQFLDVNPKELPGALKTFYLKMCRVGVKGKATRVCM